MDGTRYYESDELEAEAAYRDRQRKECRDTIIYCVLSLALLIAAGGLNNPVVIATIPGGPLTLTILSIVIVVSVLLLCIWQIRKSK